MADQLKPCPCGHAGELNGTRGIYCTLKCPECGREASAFTMEGLVVAWNDEALPANPPKRKRELCDRRVDFESDHPGPFGNAVDTDGNELDEYANARTQEDWLLWLRAQAAAASACVESRPAL
ncbi:hypothetical protein [Pseudomonas lurida]|uniref:hypothetical protein n=1 Tax=Pseudomonas lurida TaxID=244566 RepID=UPI00177AFF49|nr:hypothetical protein [Pseudomonas lurida]MBD8671568.1 hypothetical protein [Pseudomonas lurida]